MGRLPVAKLAGGPDSSPSSAESSFRELDEVFLQTQTRIWIGEVLNTRLDEDLHVSDLLQDGEILFEVSKVVWNLLLTKCMELRHLKHKYGPFGSRKSSGRYRPYSNVDSFLKVCKILGLSGIDLFSPSDVVEKRDIRKVCICIRALSKKARSKQLNVPDFDLVIYSVAMPTDMVGGIRRSLELSQCAVSSSSSYSSRKGSRKLPEKTKQYAPSVIDDDSDSEESDEAESRYMGEYSPSPTSKHDAASELRMDLEDSSDSYSMPGRNNEARHSCGNGVMEVSDPSFSLENDGFVVGENNYISDYLAFSDLMVHATDGNSSVILDGENNMFDFFLHADTLDKGSLCNGPKRRYSDDEEMEVSSTTSMSSVLCRMLNLELDDQFDPDEFSTTNVYPSEAVELETGKRYKDSVLLHEIQNNEMMSESQLSTELFDAQEAESVSRPTRLSFSTQYIPSSQNERHLSNMETPEDGETYSCGHKSVEDSEKSHEPNVNIDVQGVCNNQGSVPVVSDHTYSQANHESEDHTANPIGLRVKDMNRAPKDDHHVADDACQDKSKQFLNTLNITNGNKDTNPGVRPRHFQRPLIKTVVKGTAIASVLFLLLHIRKKRGNDGQEIQQSNGGFKQSKPLFSLKKQQKESSGKGVYPAGKIKL